MKKEELLTEVLDQVRAEQDAQQAFDEAAAELLGINMTDLRCLGILEQTGEMSATELARAASLTTGAMTALIDRLERAGFVHRSRDDGDRRRVLVGLTGRAQTAIAAIWGPLGEEGTRVAGSFSTEELRVIARYLRKSREVLGRHLKRVKGMRSIEGKSGVSRRSGPSSS